MLHQIKQVFRSPKFIVGFVLFSVVFLTGIIYLIVSPVNALQSISKKSFTPPGSYVNVQDVVEARDKRILELDTAAKRVANALSDVEKAKMISFLEEFKGLEPGSIDIGDIEALVSAWNANYDPDERIDGLLKAERNEFTRIHGRIQGVFRQEKIVVARQGENGLEEDTTNTFTEKEFVSIDNIANTFTFPLGSDNFGRDMLTQLTSAILVSLRLGLVAGSVATMIGLTLGLLAGYCGGIIDNIITFMTNIFTVIPSFVLLVLISYSLSPSTRGVNVVAVVIGVTAWPWTCRSVRSQVISLRNRDHVNLSKLSGHSMPRIILNDILPYVASYVVMALILQISSGILAEAQLSMLGLGPSTTEVATLGLMMNWAQIFSAWQSGAWWAFLPVILSIACISFSLNLMNTGLDQVFNPQLRDS